MSVIQRSWAASGLVVLLAGCAVHPVQRGPDSTAALVEARGVQANGEVRDCADPAADVLPLPDPLDLDAALRIALQCNPALGAEYARLGIARAEALQAGRLANPTLTLGVADSNGVGGGQRLDLGIAQNFTRLILRGPQRRLAEGEFLRAQQQLAGDVLNLASDVTAAWVRVAGDAELAQVRAADAEAAEASAELMARFHAAGNVSARELALARAEAGEARVEARRADEAVSTARVELQRLLGVALPAGWTMPDGLPSSGVALPPLAQLQAQAAQQRLDLAAARGLVALLADSANTTRRLRWLGDFEVGIGYEREPDRSRLLGPTLSIQLPLFDRGDGQVARAEALREWSMAESRRLEGDVAAEVARAAAETAAARARAADHRDVLLPQRAEVVARSQEEVNAMLRGVFDLIAARRDEYAAIAGYLQALRDAAVAQAALERALGARLPGEADARVRASELLTGAAADPHRHHEGMNHGGHEHGSPSGTAAPTHPHGHAQADHGAER